MRTRALITRPGRKTHYATTDGGGWLTLCNRDLPTDGTVVVGTDWTAWLTAGRSTDTQLCAHCGLALRFAAIAVDEVAAIRADEITDGIRRRDAILDDRFVELYG
jgi:hypothetical protein